MIPAPAHPRPLNNAAHFLVLFGDNDAPRAALFDRQRRLMSELVGDDGFVVDTLVQHSTACAPPCPAIGDAITRLDRHADVSLARCFRLD